MKKYTLVLPFLILLFIFVGFLGFNINSTSAANCAPGDLFHSITGQPCNGGSSLVCAPGHLFNSVTGAPCPGDGTAQINPSVGQGKFNSVFKSSFKIGSTGSDVRALQQFLKDEGYYAGRVDGIYGRITQRAIDDFREDNGLTIFPGQVTLNNQYALQLPTGVTFSQGSGANASSFVLRGADGSLTNVTIHPYTTGTAGIAGKAIISADGNTVYSNGQTITSSFVTPNGYKVFHGTQTSGTTETHDFIVVDRTNNSLIQFVTTGSINQTGATGGTGSGNTGGATGNTGGTITGQPSTSPTVAFATSAPVAWTCVDTSTYSCTGVNIDLDFFRRAPGMIGTFNAGQDIAMGKSSVIMAIPAVQAEYNYAKAKITWFPSVYGNASVLIVGSQPPEGDSAQSPIALYNSTTRQYNWMTGFSPMELYNRGISKGFTSANGYPTGFLSPAWSLTNLFIQTKNAPPSTINPTSQVAVIIGLGEDVPALNTIRTSNIGASYRFNGTLWMKI